MKGFMTMAGWRLSPEEWAPSYHPAGISGKEMWIRGIARIREYTGRQTGALLASAEYGPGWFWYYRTARASCWEYWTETRCGPYALPPIWSIWGDEILEVEWI